MLRWLIVVVVVAWMNQGIEDGTSGSRNVATDWRLLRQIYLVFCRCTIAIGTIAVKLHVFFGYLLGRKWIGPA